MKKIIFAVIFVSLLVGLVLLIPNDPSTAYPIPTPKPPVQANPGYVQFDCGHPLRWLMIEWINPPIEAYPMPSINENTGSTYYQFPNGEGYSHQNPWGFLGCEEIAYDVTSCTWGTYYIPPATAPAGYDVEDYLISGYICNDLSYPTCFHIMPLYYDVPCGQGIYLPYVRK